jgi:hypothetical protein
VKDILLATIPATIPILAVLVGILLNQNGMSRLDARITSLGGRLSTLEARFHEDILTLVGRHTDN